MIRCLIWILAVGLCPLTAAWSNTANPDTIPYPTYLDQTLHIRIENAALPCDSIDTVGNTVYYWFYDQNRWFAKVYKYYDKDLRNLQTRYLAHMAVGPDKDLIAIYLGNYYEYSKTGILLSVIRFAEGMRHGPVFFYDRQGTLRQEGHYWKGIKSGKWRYFNKSGKFKHEVEYQLPANVAEPDKDKEENDVKHGKQGFI